MRCVKLTFPRPVRDRWLLRIWRLTSSSFAGTLRTDVAVGTPRLASMFSTMRAAAPRIGLVVSPPSTSGAHPLPPRAGGGARTGAGVGAETGAVAGTGVVAAGVAPLSVVAAALPDGT